MPADLTINMSEEMVYEPVLHWFNKKGINPDTVQYFGITVSGPDDDTAIHFPYSDIEGNFFGMKHRYGVLEGKRSFSWVKGLEVIPFNLREANRSTLFVCEGETDTMRLRQELGDTPDVGVLGIPGIQTWNDSWLPYFDTAETVYIILDNDEDYNVISKVDEAWLKIRRALGSRAKRVVLPKGTKDTCEFFQEYDLDALRYIVERLPATGESRFKTLDLTAEPPPVSWVLEGMICQGDIHLMIGEPSIGKSWLTMAMAIAVANPLCESFLGHRVAKHGRVLYFDEENPEDLIYDRLSRLGLSPAIAKNIRYINNNDVRLDKNPAGVLDEALEYAPTLIILDSLTRFHTEDENNNGAMASLFHNAFKPLARETGAALVLIHHASKTDSSSGYRRARGAGDITASVDTAFDVRLLEIGSLEITTYKSRRKAQGESVYVSLSDEDDGSISLVGSMDIPVPF
jgi:hypothetical protein